MTILTQDFINNFWKRVDKESSSVFYDGTRCWEWLGGKNKDGYGKVGSRGKHFTTHRVSYELFFGEIKDNLFVLHHCDNPSCVNPRHLFLGTHQDNVDDKVQKGRQPSKDTHGRHKLTQDQVNEIRQRYERGKRGENSLRALAREFKVTYIQISHIVNFTAWKLE